MLPKAPIVVIRLVQMIKKMDTGDIWLITRLLL